MPQSKGYTDTPLSDQQIRATFTDAPLSSQLETTDARSVVEQHGLPSGVDVSVGMAKGLAKTAVGAGELVSKIPGVKQALGAVYGPETVKNSFDYVRSFLKPTNSAQSFGQGVEQVGEFFTPAGGLSKGKAALKTGSTVLNAVTGMGLEGVSAAAVDATQKGTTEDMASTGAITAGAGLGLQGLFKGGQKAAQWLSEASEKALLKPSRAALEGATPTVLVRNLFKHDLGGTLAQSYDKVSAKITERVSDLKAALTSNPTATVRLGALKQDVLKGLQGNKQAAAAMDRIEEAVEYALNKHGVQLQNGVLDLADANVAKQAVGEMGAWLKDMGGKAVSDADRITEDVANRLYRKIKVAIEQKATGGIGAINKELGELIPIRRAIIERIPVADRANVMNLGDMAGLASGNLGISVANRLFQSGRTANAASKLAKMRSDAAAANAARLVGAAQ